MRHLFRRYLASRLSMYETLPNLDAAAEELSRAAQLATGNLVRDAVAAGRDDPTQNGDRASLPALNDMIDVTTAPHHRPAHSPAAS